MRSLRIVLPLRMAVDILEHANMFTFVSAGGCMECRLDELKNRDHPVWFLQETAKAIRVTDVNSMVVHCKTIELSLNFHQ
eukprot:9159665-Lingulodinium_polyedra.AAC.1